MPDPVQLLLNGEQAIELARAEAVGLVSSLIASGDGQESISAAVTILGGLLDHGGPLRFSEEELSTVREALLHGLDD